MKKNISLLFTSVLISVIFLGGCAAKETKVGQSISQNIIMPIKDVIIQAEQLNSKTVKITGKITDECPSGGWFMLKDDTGIIYVNLHPSQLAIPQAVGRNATAEGVVYKEGPQVEVIGKGVEIK